MEKNSPEVERIACAPRHWYVMRAYKCEKKAEEKLAAGNGLEYFIAKRYVFRMCHGVKRRVLVPVIPNLVFVHATQKEIVKFKQNDCNFLQFVIWKKSTGPEYLVVPDSQMENFIKVASQAEVDSCFHRLDEIDFHRGMRVRVHDARFETGSAEGMLVKVKGRRNRRFVVVLDGVGALSVDVPADSIEVIK